jgi:hypothetical protein
MAMGQTSEITQQLSKGVPFLWFVFYSGIIGTLEMIGRTS